MHANPRSSHHRSSNPKSPSHLAFAATRVHRVTRPRYSVAITAPQQENHCGPERPDHRVATKHGTDRVPGSDQPARMAVRPSRSCALQTGCSCRAEALVGGKYDHGCPRSVHFTVPDLNSPTPCSASPAPAEGGRGRVGVAVVAAYHGQPWNPVPRLTTCWCLEPARSTRRRSRAEADVPAYGGYSGCVGCTRTANVFTIPLPIALTYRVVLPHPTHAESGSLQVTAPARIHHDKVVQGCLPESATVPISAQLTARLTEPPA